MKPAINHFVSDFEINDQGTIVLFTPLVETAKQHLKAHCPGALWFGGALVCEHRYAAKLAEALNNDGFTIE